MTEIAKPAESGKYNARTENERTFSARDIGRRLFVTNAEREAWALWAIHPCDMTDEELATFRSNKRRKQLEKRRRSKGIKSRAEYLAEVAKPKPWIAAGVSRRTYFRRMAPGVTPAHDGVALGLSPTILGKEESHPVPPQQVESQQEASSEEGEVKRSNKVTKAEEAERLKPSRPRGLGTHPVPTLSNIADLMRERSHEAWRNRNAKG